LEGSNEEPGGGTEVRIKAPSNSPEGGELEAQQIKWMTAKIYAAQKSPLWGDLPARRRQGGAPVGGNEEPGGGAEVRIENFQNYRK
jgi:hypothetical protein